MGTATAVFPSLKHGRIFGLEFRCHRQKKMPRIPDAPFRIKRHQRHPHRHARHFQRDIGRFGRTSGIDRHALESGRVDSDRRTIPVNRKLAGLAYEKPLVDIGRIVDGKDSETAHTIHFGFKNCHLIGGGIFQIGPKPPA